MDNITITCINTDTPAGMSCTFTPFFSAGEMLISLLLLIGLIFGIITIVAKGAFKVAVNYKDKYDHHS